MNDTRALSSHPSVHEDATSAFVRLIHDIAAAANDAPSANDAIAACLARICAATGFAYGGVFFREGDALLPGRVHHAEDPARVHAFVEATSRTRFSPGIGVLGRVLTTSRPAWMSDVQRDLVRGAAARQSGLRASLAFPVLVGHETAAVIELLSEREVEPDDALLATMSCIGTLLGRAIERERHARAIAQLATVDAPTGLANARGFAILAGQQLKIAARMERTPTVLVAQVMGAAEIAGRFGAEELERALKETATLLRNGFRDSDIVARLGEAEFAVFAVDTCLNQSDALKERIRRNCEALGASRTRRYPLALAVGASVFDPRHPEPLDAFVQRARDAVTEPKRRAPASAVVPAMRALDFPRNGGR